MAFNPKNLRLIHVQGSPFADDPPDADAYYAAFARVVVSWGRFEQNLDDAVSLLGRMTGAPTPRDGHPRNFRKKIKRLKKLCSDVPLLKPLHDSAKTLSSKALPVALRRHELVHSNWQRFLPNRTELTVEFSTIKWGDQKDECAKFDLSLSELKSLVDAIYDLNALTVSFLPKFAEIHAAETEKLRVKKNGK